MSRYISLGSNSDGTPNLKPRGDDIEAAPRTDVAVDMAGDDIRLWVDNEGEGNGCAITYMQPNEARRLATYLTYAAEQCEQRDREARGI